MDQESPNWEVFRKISKALMTEAIRNPNIETSARVILKTPQAVQFTKRLAEEQL
jgi:hypothetical protein